MTIQAVLLDADGVLQRPGDGHRDSLARLSAGARGGLDAFIDDVFAAEFPCMTGEADFEAGLADVLRRWNSPSGVADALAMWTSIHVFEGVRDVVREVQATGIRCCLATNQERHRGASMSRALGYATLFDVEFYSWQLGVAKPDPRYFERCLERLELPPEATLFLDDREGNVASAARVGLRAELVPPVPDEERAVQLRTLLATHLAS